MTLTLNIALRQMFPTPIAALETPDAEARNAELKAIILGQRRIMPSMRASNSGGWHSDREIMAWGGPRMAEIVALAEAVANHMTRDRQGKAVRPAWTVTAWANVNGQGDGNICHYHPGSFWSGTYYVDDGGCGSDESLGGQFEILDPRGPGPAMLAPSLTFAGDTGQSAGSTEIIRPRSGLMIVFPSWLYHQVRPYRGEGERISIAFNLRI